MMLSEMGIKLSTWTYTPPPVHYVSACLNYLYGTAKYL